MTLSKIKSKLKKLANPTKAKLLRGFFKTGPGQYGEGDIFLGLTVPESRSIAKAHHTLPLRGLQTLLHSGIHEERLIALLILIGQYRKGTAQDQRMIFNFYLKNTSRVNNWDLVDLSAHHIVGHFLERKSRAILHKLAQSSSLWERRISIVATWHFIRQNDLKDTFRLAEALMQDSEDLIHKATGWMLREAGKKSTTALESFLKIHGPKMPRTMLRYAIEKFPEAKRRVYLRTGP